MAELLAFEEALTRILDRAQPLPTERVPLEQAAGRVLAEAALSRADLPPFASSAMDGFAVRAEETPGRLPIEARVAAGSPSLSPLSRGAAATIATGGAVPEGADAVVPIERAEETDGHVQILEAARSGAHIRPRGGDVREGDPVVEAGTRLGPAQIGALAAAGIGEVVCSRRPRVAILATGSELRPPGEVLAAGQIFNDENYYDANGILVPIETYMDRIDPDHKLEHVAVKLASQKDLAEVSATMIGRAKQAHHNIEDVEITDLAEELARSYQNFLDQMRGWTIVLMSLAATVLLVGGVGVLSVMLISFSDRRYEIGLRKAMGASDHEVFTQFILEALVLAAVGAFAGTVAGAAVCQALSPKFPYGLIVNPIGLLIAWATALALALVFGMYPAIRASRLSPMEAMR